MSRLSRLLDRAPRAAARSLAFLLFAAVACDVSAQGWRVGSAIGSPGELVAVDLFLTTAAPGQSGGLGLFFDANWFVVEQIDAAAGSCTLFEGGRVEANAAPSSAGEYLVCRIKVRIAATAWPHAVRAHYVYSSNCAGSTPDDPCPVEEGGIKIRGSGIDPLMSFSPSPPVAHRAFELLLTVYCDSFWDEDRVPYAVEVHQGRIRVTGVVMSSMPVCPNGISMYRIPIPALPEGSYRLEVFDRYYGADPRFTTLRDLAEVHVAPGASAAAPTAIPAGTWSGLAVLALLMTLVGAMRVRSPQSCLSHSR